MSQRGVVYREELYDVLTGLNTPIHQQSQILKVAYAHAVFASQREYRYSDSYSWFNHILLGLDAAHFNFNEVTLLENFRYCGLDILFREGIHSLVLFLVPIIHTE